jgi:hypothetical protein
MFKHFNIYAFVFGIIIGIIGIYFVKPEQTQIVRNPHPDNVGKLVYKNKNGICYKYTAKKIDCDKNESRLSPYPLT